MQTPPCFSTTTLELYVEYIIVTSSSNRAIIVLLPKLSENFVIKDLADLHYFFGIELTCTIYGLFLPQAKYGANLLAHVHMTGCMLIPTPLSTKEKLSLTGGTLLGPKNSSSYRSIVVALLYLTLTRPDLAFLIN
jgi:histone deacetylase 1/2